MRTIKRYANRKLYDTTSSKYVTLTGVSALVKTGEDIMVMDKARGVDITAQTLAQALYEEEKRGNLLSVPNLTRLIREGDKAVVG